MKLFSLFFLIFSFNAFACWKLEAQLQTGEQKVSINQKMDLDKTYSFPSSPYIFNVKLISESKRPGNMPKKKGTHLIMITVDEKNGTSLTEVATGMILVNADKEATMEVSGSESARTPSTFKVKVTEI